MLSVKTALEVLYSQGYTELPVTDFIRGFSEKYDLSENDEKKVRSMLRVLQRNNVIKEYFRNCSQVLQSREYTYDDGKKTARVYWTEIPCEELQRLVDDKDMLRILEYCVKKGQYSKSISNEIKKVYNKTDKKRKLKRN